MATSQMVRSEDKSGTWSSMFPVEQVTEQQSTLFAKKLLAVAISNITYLRAIFPERAYGDRCLGDLNLKILRDDSSCPGASQVIKWVKGCFDALDKKYLRMLIIGIYVDPEDPSTVIESYTFKFSYSSQCGVDVFRNGKKITSAHTTEKTKKETIQLLRTIIVLTQSLQSLPDNVMMTMKLLYYDEVTPTDYEPPGFKPSDHDSFRFEDEPVNIKLGDVSTPFHSVKMRIKTDRKQFDIKDEAEDAQNGQTISNSGLDKDQEQEPEKKFTGNLYRFGNSTKKDVISVEKEPAIPIDSPAMPEKSRGPGSSVGEATPKEDEFKVRCPCACNEDDGLMIVCDICHFWQHAVCFAILDEENAPEEHVCDVCAKDGNNCEKATDPYLNELTSFGVQATCLWRRTLAACSDFTRLLAPQFGQRLGVDTTVAQGLINRLEKEGYVHQPNKGKRLGKVVDKEKVRKEAIPAYFKPAAKSIETNKDKNSIQNSEEASSKKEPAVDQQIKEFKHIDVLQVTEKTASISVNSKQLQPASISINSKQLQPTTATTVHKLEETSVTNSGDASMTTENQSRNSRKRAFSKIDQNEFDLSNSNDAYDTRSRRKKCSDAQKSITV